jgi:hypothetical protein
VSRTTNWFLSVLVLPLMGLLYVSYRVQIGQAVAKSELAGLTAANICDCHSPLVDNSLVRALPTEPAPVTRPE